MRFAPFFHRYFDVKQLFPGIERPYEIKMRERLRMKCTLGLLTLVPCGSMMVFHTPIGRQVVGGAHDTEAWKPR